MKRWHLPFAALLVCLVTSAAQAQFVVSDPELEATATATTVGVDTLNASARELIGHVSVPRPVEDGLPLPAPMGSPTVDQQLFQSETAAPSPAATLYSESLPGLIGTDAELERLKRELAGATNAVGIANTNLSTLDARLAAGQASIAKLSSASDLMQATVNNGLMLKRNHDAAILAAQAAYFNALVTSQAQLNAAKEAVEQREEHQKTMLIFGTRAP